MFLKFFQKKKKSEKTDEQMEMFNQRIKKHDELFQEADELIQKARSLNNEAHAILESVEEYNNKLRNLTLSTDVQHEFEEKIENGIAIVKQLFSEHDTIVARLDEIIDEIRHIIKNQGENK